jgi:hypothetical protein
MVRSPDHPKSGRLAWSVIIQFYTMLLNIFWYISTRHRVSMFLRLSISGHNRHPGRHIRRHRSHLHSWRT